MENPAKVVCSKDQVLFQVEKMCAQFATLWRRSPNTFPVWEHRYDRKRQTENKGLARGLIDELVTVPHTRDKGLMRVRVTAVMERFTSSCLGWPAEYRKLAFSDAFFQVTGDFSCRARALDKEVVVEDLYQALRNVWIAYLIQMVFKRPTRLGDAVFAYSMLYPYTDNPMDDPDRTESEKEATNRRLEARLAGDETSPRDRNEARVFDMVSLIEADYPRDPFPEIYQSLLAINRAQKKSLRQQGETRLDEADLLAISIEKGGTSVLTDGYLVNGTLCENQATFVFGYGVLLQLLDDLQDCREDDAAGCQTLFTRAAQSGPLDTTLNRLFHFLEEVVDLAKKLENQPAPELTELIRTNCRLLMVQAVAQQPELFSRDYRRGLTAFSPFPLAAIPKLKRQLFKGYNRARRGLLRLGESRTPFEMLG